MGPCRDHPRARGEQPLTLFLLTEIEGSSPRARGAVGVRMMSSLGCGIIPARAGSSNLPMRFTATHRIIPARAGSSWMGSCSSFDFWDHPRARGEQGVPSSKTSSSIGSSPRARGAVENERHNHTRQRIIPARAGSSGYPRRATARTRDHPRARGEQISPPKTDRGSEGSSPRARGAVVRGGDSISCLGIIPARAGSR